MVPNNIELYDTLIKIVYISLVNSIVACYNLHKDVTIINHESYFTQCYIYVK